MPVGASGSTRRRDRLRTPFLTGIGSIAPWKVGADSAPYQKGYVNELWIATARIRMVLLVTSASGANGAGRGKLLTFGENGELLGSFSEDARIVDPRALGVDNHLLFLNSGSDRILALD